MAAAPAISLTTRIEDLAGVPRPLLQGLQALGLTNLGRLIAHQPMRHERLEPEAPIAQLAPGHVVSARGQIVSTRPVPFRPRPRFEAVLLDSSGRLDIVWFNSLYLRDKIHAGARIRVEGKAQRHKGGIQLINPRFWVLDGEAGEPVVSGEVRIRPVYPAGEGVTSRQIERALTRLLPHALPLLDDHLPEHFRRERQLPSLAEAYRMVHAPGSLDEAAAGRRRLAYDELLFLQLGVHMKRAHLRGALTAPALAVTPEIDGHIRGRFPFPLTPAQDRVIEDLKRDLSRSVPTNRLIQGDVGSGKTVVALYGMLLAVASGHQAALMAPTEILAAQHYESVSSILKGSRVRVAILTGATPDADRPALRRALAAGEIDVLIGTHALLTESVRFKSLGVSIIDEQHRFGVHQRATLRTKAPDGRPAAPHMLVMTATPIPRTLAITLFGDLDISTIDELPPGRTPVATRVVGPEGRIKVYQYVRKRLEGGDQAYIVAPAIEPGDSASTVPGLPAVTTPGPAGDVRTLLKWLQEGPLLGLPLAALHGRLRSGTREAVLARFRAGRIGALVSTTVIEVGVDVPNATIMVVEEADRFGLAQLHQLRGRVGRGSKKSLCVYIADAGTPDAQARLAVLAKTSDGFALAEKDLELRGPGELFGTRQSGMPPFRVADLARDLDLLKMARRDAADWIVRSPMLTRPEEAVLLKRLIKAHGRWLGLGDVG